MIIEERRLFRTLFLYGCLKDMAIIQPPQTSQAKHFNPLSLLAISTFNLQTKTEVESFKHFLLQE